MINLDHLDARSKLRLIVSEILGATSNPKNQLFSNLISKVRPFQIAVYFYR
jgi:hypothetical protein